MRNDIDGTRNAVPCSTQPSQSCGHTAGDSVLAMGDAAKAEEEPLSNEHLQILGLIQLPFLFSSNPMVL